MTPRRDGASVLGVSPPDLRLLWAPDVHVDSTDTCVNIVRPGHEGAGLAGVSGDELELLRRLDDRTGLEAALAAAPPLAGASTVELARWHHRFLRLERARLIRYAVFDGDTLVAVATPVRSDFHPTFDTVSDRSIALCRFALLHAEDQVLSLESPRSPVRDRKSVV